MYQKNLMPRRAMACVCVALSVGMALCGILQSALAWSRAQLDVGSALCSDTLRLHIRADSDSVLDQSIKLRVRDTVLALADESCRSADKPEALAWAARSLPRIQLEAQCALARLGVRTAVRVRLVNMYFDAVRYRGFVLPSGRYDAVRVELGDEKHYGQNWWCVLYPGLCREACGEYASPQENDLVCGEYIIRFRLVDAWAQLTARRGSEELVAV